VVVALAVVVLNNISSSSAAKSRSQKRGKGSWHQQSITEEKYLGDPHARVHRAFTDGEHTYWCWERDWPRDQCVTVAQVHTGNSSLVAAYLYRIGRRESATCPCCQSADETVCSTVQLKPRSGGTLGQEATSQPIHEAFGTSWNEQRRSPAPLTRNERERAWVSEWVGFNVPPDIV